MEDGNNNENKNEGQKIVWPRPSAPKADDVGTTALPYQKEYKEALDRIRAGDDKASVKPEKPSQGVEGWAISAAPLAPPPLPKQELKEIIGGPLENWFLGPRAQAAEVEAAPQKKLNPLERLVQALSNPSQAQALTGPSAEQQKAAQAKDLKTFKENAVGGTMEKAVKRHGLKFFVAMAISTIAGGLGGRAMQEPRMGQTVPDREGTTEVAHIRGEQVSEMKIEATLEDQVNGVNAKIKNDAKRMMETPAATSNVKTTAPAEMTPLGPGQGTKIGGSFDGTKSAMGDFAKAATKLSYPTSPGLAGLSNAPAVDGPTAKDPVKTGKITPTRILTIDELKR